MGKNNFEEPTNTNKCGGKNIVAIDVVGQI